MSAFFTQLWARPAEASTRLSRFTQWCGYGYAVVGATIMFFPESQVIVGLSPPFQGQEEGLMRTLGFVLMLIGYFYVFGGRTGRTSFGLCTVLDRFLVPFFLAFIYFTSDTPLYLLLPLGALDPILGLVAYACWRADEGERT